MILLQKRVNKRIIASLIAIFMSTYFGVIVKKYIKKEAY